MIDLRGNFDSYTIAKLFNKIHSNLKKQILSKSRFYVARVKVKHQYLQIGKKQTVLKLRKSDLLNITLKSKKHVEIRENLLKLHISYEKYSDEMIGLRISKLFNRFEVGDRKKKAEDLLIKTKLKIKKYKQEFIKLKNEVESNN